MSGLDKVKEELMKVIEKEVQDYTDEVYRSGHDDGYERGINKQNDYWYQRGLEDAWECARDVVDMSEPQLSEDYGLVSLYHVFNEMTADQVMKKIMDYEERQTDEIKVGDEVKVYDDCIGIVTRHAPQARTCYVMYRDGSCGEEELNDCKKTGNHSMSLDKWLEQMRKGRE